MELLLVRHAEPFRVTDPTGADPVLTPEGEEQARRLAKALGDRRYGHVTRLVSSPMRRARQTTSFVEATLGLDATVDDRLAELDHGWTTYGVANGTYPRRGMMLADMNVGRVGANTFDPTAFRTRVQSGLDAVVEGAADDSDVTAVICHGGVINVCLSRVVGASRMFFTEPFYTSVTRVHVAADGYWEVLSLNEVDHLRV